MSCSEVRELYSEYRDGLLSDPCLRERVDLHLLCCDSCLRYYRGVDRGLAALAASRDISPSPAFRVNLFHRLLGVDDPACHEPVMPGRARLAAALIVAAALGMLLLDDGEADRVRTIPGAETAQRSQRPMPMVLAKRSYPFVTFADLSAPVYEHQVSSVTGTEVSLSTWVRQPRR